MASGLGGFWTSRMVSKPEIAVEFIASQPASKIPRYREIMETAWAMIARGFSAEAVYPGVTTTEDLEWWFREEIIAHNFSTWFQPSVSVVDEASPFAASMDVGGDVGTMGGSAGGGRVIQYGDMLHVDFGLTAMGLNTDTQHLGYVLRPGEDDVPESLKEGLRKGNKVQDIVRRNIAVGKTGNEMLTAVTGEMREAGIEGRVYTHPIGDWGHSAGPVIGELVSFLLRRERLLTSLCTGMTNMQEYVPATGELAAIPSMWFSVELFVEHYVPERNKTLWFALEEDVYWAGEQEGWQWVYARQEEFHLIKAAEKQEAMEEL